MNYAWEAVLWGERAGRNRDAMRFAEAVSPSPYIEVSAEDLNLECPEEDLIEINPLYRLGDVFGRLFDCNVEGLDQTREVFFDVCMHYIVQLDLREGLTREDYYCGMLAESICGGQYGAAVKSRFQLFDKGKQKTILHSYLQFLKTGNYLEELRKVIMRLYPCACIYENNERAFELLIYLGVRETAAERERTTFLQEMFLPVQAVVHWFYEYHFGIIGIDETMVVDEMMVF